MISRLYIQNYALIERLEIDFTSGFSVITGETGAGKSIILGALSLILGQRAESKYIKSETEKSVIEGEFDVSAYALETFFETNDLEYEGGNCLLRRELAPSGKSRAFINDTPVSLSLLKELGDMLIDIHSQHQNLLLADTHFQLRVIDVMAANKNLLGEYKSAFKQLQSCRKLLHKLEEENLKNKQDEDYFRFQWEQLDEAKLQPGEQEDLEVESRRLSHAEEIKGTLFAMSQTADGDELSLLSLLKSMQAKAQSLHSIYPGINEIATRLQSNYIDLKDIAQELDVLQEEMQVDPERLQQVDERLDLLYRLQQKHNEHDVSALITLRDDIAVKLSQIEGNEEEIEKIKKEIEVRQKEVEDLAEKLTESRRRAIPQFAAKLQDMVRPLGMNNVQFEVEMLPQKQMTENGAEEVSFLFTANKNQPLQKVASVASGGEISRLMLCIKALIGGATALPTIIFDEVDTGVSGDIAEKMGHIMRDMSRHMQVISITHLPQVASKGNQHYRVFKQDTESATETSIKKLNEIERVHEIAAMLSGATLTDAAMHNARELLGKTNN